MAEYLDDYEPYTASLQLRVQSTAEDDDSRGLFATEALDREVELLDEEPPLFTAEELEGPAALPCRHAHPHTHSSDHRTANTNHMSGQAAFGFALCLMCGVVFC